MTATGRRLESDEADEALRLAAQRAVHPGPVIDRVNGFDVIACETCGFTHVLPLPDPDIAAAQYTNSYYADVKASYLAHAGEDRDWAALAWGDRLDALARELGGPGRILDIGTGPGFFLAEAKARGWHCVGIEPSAMAAAHARGLGIEIIEGAFDDAAADAAEPVDAVHLNNVLEHVPDPVTFLARAVGVLPAGGAICAGVPNDYSAMQAALRARGTRPWWLAPPHHLNYFTFETLERLMESLGLEPAGRLTSFPMELFALMGEDYIAEPARGRGLHHRRVAFDRALEAADGGASRRAFYGALAAAGFGREAVVIALKR